MLCGTEPHPKDFKAKKYRLEKHSLSKEDFVHIMKNLPVFFITTIIMNTSNPEILYNCSDDIGNTNDNDRYWNKGASGRLRHWWDVCLCRQKLRWQALLLRVWGNIGKHWNAQFGKFFCLGDGQSTATPRGAEATHIRYRDGSPGFNHYIQTKLVESAINPAFLDVFPTLPILVPGPIRLRLPPAPHPQALPALLLQGLSHLPLHPGGHSSDISKYILRERCQLD